MKKKEKTAAKHKTGKPFRTVLNRRTIECNKTTSNAERDTFIIIGAGLLGAGSMNTFLLGNFPLSVALIVAGVALLFLWLDVD